MAFGIRRFFKGIRLNPESTTSIDSKGEFEVLSSNGKANYHNGTTASPVVTEAHTATLTNKSIDADTNTITNIDNNEIKAAAAIDATKIANGSVSNTEFQFLDGVTSAIQTQLNGKASSTLTSAHILVGNVSNVATDVAVSGDISIDNTGNAQIASGVIVNADVNASAAIARSKLGTGTINHVVINDGSGNFSSEATLAKSRGGSGQDNSSLNFPASGTLATLAGAEALTNKTITIADANLTIQDDGDATKQLKFQASGIATATTRTLTAPDANTTIVGTDATQVITNKDIDGGTASNSLRLTLPKNTKTNLDALTRKQGTLVYSTDLSKVYYDDGSTLKAVGSSAGGGINFLNLDTTWVFNNSDNSDLETSIGSWVTYNDSSQIPVDMTGGSATSLTLSRTTTAGEILDGIASLKLVKSATNAQGQGISCVLNVPPAYQGKTAQIIIPFKVSSGSLASGDIKVFMYDITNSAIITPFNNDMIGTNGTIRAIFSTNGPATTPANVQMRVGVHFYGTSASAVTFQLDDIQVSPVLDPSFGAMITDMIPYTPTYQGTSAPTTNEVWYRQVGDKYEVSGRAVLGTVNSSEFRIGLPNSAVIDTNKLNNVKQVGIWASNQSSVNIINTFVNANGGNNYVTFSYENGGNNNFNNILGNQVFANGQVIGFQFEVPIVGLSSNITLSGSSTFRMSGILTNGTRVTTTPTALGQYRSRSKTSATSNTFADAAPTTAIGFTDGMKIDPANYTSAQTSGLISLYDIYIGLNKNYRIESFTSTGRTGQVLTDYAVQSSTVSSGIRNSYDPTTGVLTIEAGINELTSNTTRNLGYNISASAVTSGYFDVVVAENALAVGVQTPRCMISVNGGNGHGSSGTRVRRYTQVKKSVGFGAITYTDSATNGGSWTINEDGVYSVTACDSGSGGSNWGISLNATALSTDIISQASDKVLTVVTSGPTNRNTVAFTGYFVAGDIIRIMDDGSLTQTNGVDVQATVVKVSN